MLLLYAGAMVPAAAAAQWPLERVIVFSDARSCTFGEPLARIFSGLARWNERTGRNEAGPPVRIAGLARPLVPTLRRLDRDYLSAAIPLRGRWHGLTVTRIDTIFIPESDVGANRIHFAEPRARVLAVLNARGFGLDPRTYSATVDVRTPEMEQSVTLSLERSGAGTIFSCGPG